MSNPIMFILFNIAMDKTCYELYLIYNVSYITDKVIDNNQNISTMMIPNLNIIKLSEAP